MIGLSGRKIGAVTSYALMVVEIVSGLLFTPFLIRSLGQAEYGVYSLTLTITAYFTLLDFGVGNALIRYLSQYRAEGDVLSQRRFIGLSLIFYLVVCVVMFVLFFVLSQNLSLIFGNSLTGNEIELSKQLLGITIVNAAVTMMASVFGKAILAYEYFAVSNLLQILRVLLRVAVQVVLLLCGFGSLGVVASNFVLTILLSVVNIAFVVKAIGLIPLFKGFGIGFVKEIVGYSSFIFIQMVATQINSMADQVILGIFASSTILGVYAVAAQINQYYQSIASGVNNVTMPGIVKMVTKGASGEELACEMVKVGRLSLIVIGIVMGGVHFGWE